MELVIASLPVPLAVDTSGVVRVADTRVTLDSIVTAYLNGASAEQIAEDFDALSLADIHTVIGYYLRHTDEVQRYLGEQRRLAKDVREEVTAVVAPGGIRQRLVARLPKKGPDSAPLGN
jgi:uncharacterized protein (DUF433 family)